MSLSALNYILCFLVIAIFTSSTSYAQGEKELIFGHPKRYFKAQDGKSIDIKGKITNIKRHLRARSTFYTFDVNDNQHKINVRLYTINWLKRVNNFECKNGETIILKAETFYLKDKGPVLGLLRVSKKAQKLECLSKLEKNNQKGEI